MATCSTSSRFFAWPAPRCSSPRRRAATTRPLRGHEVQFTPGGSLAVVDGRLTPLPGAAAHGRWARGRLARDRRRAARTVRLDGAAAARRRRELAPVGGDRAGRSCRSCAPRPGRCWWCAEPKQRPRVATLPGAVTLQFPAPVALARAGAAGGRGAGGRAARRTRSPCASPPASRWRRATRSTTRRASSCASRSPSRRHRSSRRSGGPLVVLDPGHGGEDQGARGPAASSEKDDHPGGGAGHRGAAAGSGRDRAPDARGRRDVCPHRPHGPRQPAAGRRSSSRSTSTPHRPAGRTAPRPTYMSVDASDPQAAQAAARENASAASDTVQLILWDLAHVANLNSFGAPRARRAGTPQRAAGDPRPRHSSRRRSWSSPAPPCRRRWSRWGSSPTREEASRLLAPDTQEEVAGGARGGDRGVPARRHAGAARTVRPDTMKALRPSGDPGRRGGAGDGGRARRGVGPLLRRGYPPARPPLRRRCPGSWCCSSPATTRCCTGGARGSRAYREETRRASGSWSRSCWRARGRGMRLRSRGRPRCRRCSSTARQRLHRPLAAASRRGLRNGTASWPLVYGTVNSVVANCPGVRRVQLLFGGREVTTLGHLDLSRPLPPNPDLVAR